ncbi:Myb domain protein 62 [Tanacetum coccineum]|uniref:Myb domain protein 62 n=1 Tax=Tanacetum coccineum TaxID=301880 RepID=A0ABQ5EQS8_9ASTR
MDKSWMNIVHRLSDPRYELGVMKFLDFAYRDKDRSLEIPCPCKICHHFRPQKKDVVYSHLMQKGISLDYIRWTEHAMTFTDVVRGQEKHEVARTFSALLQLSSDAYMKNKGLDKMDYSRSGPGTGPGKRGQGNEEYADDDDDGNDGQGNEEYDGFNDDDDGDDGQGNEEYNGSDDDEYGDDGPDDDGEEHEDVI